MADDSSPVPQVGLYGLATMGQNLALNIAEHFGPIAVCNRSPAKVDECLERANKEGNLPVQGFKEVEEFIQSLAKPRKVIVLVKAGKPVDDTIELFMPYLEKGDIVIDGGNEWYPESVRRGNELLEKNILFVGMGVSGGEEGARHGPSLMPGCRKEAYDQISPILTKIAARADDGTPCVTHLGDVGSGNYVKMVHNGIEYADMQLIAEAYDILKKMGGMSNEELSKVFGNYNTTELESFLIEITGKIFSKKDDETGEGQLVDKILDKTGMKGTGTWTVREAANRAVAAPVISAALDARYMSANKDERKAASKVLNGPVDLPNVDKEQLVNDLKDALYAAKICCYAQGMNIIKAGSSEEKWNVNLGECAKIWRGGCIIRARLLNNITSAFERNHTLENLLVDPNFAEELNKRQTAWRRIVSLAVAAGIPAPAFSAALNYFDSYRLGRLPSNLIQAQRDFFGAHTFQRTDKDGTFHATWQA